SSRFRRRTGPMVGSMLSAIQASVGVIDSAARLDEVAPTNFGAQLTDSEWDLVVVRPRGSCFGWRCRFAGPCAAGAFLVPTTTPSTGAAGTATKKLETFTNDFQLAPFLSGLLVVPSVELQASLDKNRTPLF